MNTKTDSKYTLTGCLIVILISMVLSAVLTPYCVNHWLEWAGRAQTFRWYHGALIGIIPHVGFLSIPASIITFILSFFF